MTNLGLYTGDLDATRRHAAELVALGDPSARVAGLLSLVLAFVYSGQLAEADDALDLLEREQPLAPTNEAWVAYGFGEVFAATGRTDDAIEQFDRVVRLGTSVGSSLVVSVAQVSSLAVRARTGDIGEAMAAFVPVLTQYRRSRSFTHAATGLRNLIELLVRAAHYEPAMVLLGGLSSPDVKATYGIESEYLDKARETATRHIGPTAVSSLIQQGSCHSVTWAIDHAIDVLTEIGAPS